jgi:hypothetical protein
MPRSPNCCCQRCAQDDDRRSDAEPEESDGGRASGFVVSDGHLSASEVRDEVGMDVDDADGDLDGDAPPTADGLRKTFRFDSPRGKGAPSFGVCRVQSGQTLFVTDVSFY